jgi:serine/threonine-protein phosphatase 2B regulatory subunit
MGCTISEPFYQSHRDLRAYKKEFDQLTLTESDISKLYKIFCFADVSKSGTIILEEMLMYFKLNDNNFARRIFAIFDDDDSGDIDFREFVISTWNYCTLSDQTLGLFAFDLYDKNASGYLDKEDIKIMFEDVYGKGNKNIKS